MSSNSFSFSAVMMALPISWTIFGMIEFPNDLSRCTLPCTPLATRPNLGSAIHQLGSKALYLPGCTSVSCDAHRPVLESTTLLLSLRRSPGVFPSCCWDPSLDRWLSMLVSAIILLLSPPTCCCPLLSS